MEVIIEEAAAQDVLRLFSLVLAQPLTTRKTVDEFLFKQDGSRIRVS